MKDAQNGMKSTEMSVFAETPHSIFWKLVEARPGRKADTTTDMNELKNFILELRDNITDSDERCNISLFAYYPVKRAVLDIPLRVKTGLPT